MALKPLDALGYDLSFFHLDTKGGEKEEETVYYMFEENANLYAEDWNILGIHWITQAPLLFELRLLHIEDEMLDPADKKFYHALNNAESYLSVNPPQLEALIQFLTGILPQNDTSTVDQSFLHFRQMNNNELVAMHFEQWQIEHSRGRYYQYFPSKGLQSEEKISMICFPLWSSKYGVFQSSMIECVTFERQRLADPEFEPLNSSLPWAGTMLLDQPALQEFIMLLGQHAFK